MFYDSIDNSKFIEYNICQCEIAAGYTLNGYAAVAHKIRQRTN